VLWAEVAQEGLAMAGSRVYTIAAQTDAMGLIYLAVPVERSSSGALRLSGYPAIVGAPTSVGAGTASTAREVEEPALTVVAGRVLRNYLAGDGSELQADLASSARVSPPAQALTLESLQRLDWSHDGRAVVAMVQAQDARGARYTLEYELDVVLEQGRWEVQAVEIDPNA
jgi:hypothetical protein